MEGLFFGVTTKLVDDWRSFIPAPVAPANYKDPEKIQDYFERAWTKLENEALMNPLCAKVCTFSVYDTRRGEYTYRRGNAEFLQFLRENVSTIYNDNSVRLITPTLVGFGLRDYLRIALVNGAAENERLDKLRWMWQVPVLNAPHYGICDPLVMATGQSGDIVVAIKLMDRFQMSTELPESWVGGGESARNCFLAHQLFERMTSV